MKAFALHKETAIRCHVAVAVTCVAFYLAAFSANAGEYTTQLTVSAHVPPMLHFERVAGPDVLAVDAQDARIGYKDVSLRYSLRSNEPSGVIVRLTPLIGLTKSMTVSGLSQVLTLKEDEVEVWRARSSELALQVRFHLRDEVVPGVYPLPLVVWAWTWGGQVSTAAASL
jgi:hypothetical protein